MGPGRPLSRRELMRLGLAALTAGAAWPGRVARAAVDRAAPRSLAFRNLHTGEEVSVAYRVDGRLVPEALREIDWVLRDHRTGEARPMDPRLLDLLAELRDALDTDAPFEIISGYRSPATNALLARTTTGVSRASLHVSGRATDVRVPGLSLAALRDRALGLRRGGVGFYAVSDFVHVDVGRVRSW